MKLFIAADHGGYQIKEALKKAAPDIEWTDFGVMNEESVDYPDFAKNVCNKILETRTPAELLKPQAILICGSGVGMSIQANRFKGIRAVLAFSPELAKMSRLHNASNVLCLGGRFLNPEQALDIFKTWKTTPFEGGRHERRVTKLDS